MNEIGNSELVTQVFGGWPGFHDAEVVSVLMERRGIKGPSLTARIYAFDASGETDATGCYILKNKVLVTLRFDGLVLEQLQEFGHQNVLFHLHIRDIADEPLSVTQYRNEYLVGTRFRVDLETSGGLHGSFGCKNITVVSVEPWEGDQ